MPDGSYKRKLFWLITITTVIRTIIACIPGLGNDEVYYYTYALQPDINHFDHPPFVGYLIRISTFNLSLVNDFTMRVGAIIFAAIGTGLIALTGKYIRNERAGFLAAILYNISIYTSVISGLFIMPDSTAVVFWLAAAYSALRLTDSRFPAAERKHFLYFGLWVGLAMMSKVHGIFLWFGLGAYIVIYKPILLKSTYLYISVLLTLIIISPIIIWNIQHDFITWQFHGDRVSLDRGLNFQSFITATLGQFFYNNPFVVVLTGASLLSLLKGKRTMHKNHTRLLVCCGLPIILATIFLSFFRSVLPHWSGPGFLMLILPTAVWLERKNVELKARFYFNLLRAGSMLTITVLIVGVLATQFFPGTMGKKKEQELGKGDITLDMYHWQALAPLFDSLRQQDVQAGIMNAHSPLVVSKWFPGGHLLYYVARPLQMEVVGAGSLHDLHKFVWLNKESTALQQGQNAYFISPSNYFTNPVDTYGHQYEKIELATTIPQTRSGKIARYWYIYRLIQFKG